MSTRRHKVSAAAFAIALIGACEPEPDPPPPEPNDDFHDPLSTPAEPTLSLDDFQTADKCLPCHQVQYDEWRTSTHAYAMIDPVFRALVEQRQADLDGVEDQFCTQCHSAIGTRGGDIVPGFSFDELEPITLDGVTCEACHKIASLERHYNSGHELDPTGPQRGTLEETDATHEVAYSELYRESAYCAGCHDVIETNGIELERPFGEWLESPARQSGTTCQDCHMEPREGRAAQGGPVRTVHDHRFIGVDVPLSEGFLTETEREAVSNAVFELLVGAASVELGAEPVAPGEDANLLVGIRNEIAGHNLPTGTTSIRECWLQLEARDADGNLLYQTGHLDENGDLRHHFSELDPYGDPDLLLFNSTLLDIDGNPTVFSWRAAELRSNTIPPHYTRTFTLFVPTSEETPGPIEIEAELRFRSHPPYLLRKLDLGHLVDRIPTFTIAAASTTIPLSEP